MVGNDTFIHSCTSAETGVEVYRSAFLCLLPKYQIGILFDHMPQTMSNEETNKFIYTAVHIMINVGLAGFRPQHSVTGRTLASPEEAMFLFVVMLA